MKPILSAIIGATCLFTLDARAETLTIATVNNGDMIRMQGLTAEFTKANPGIEVKWVTLEENVLREKVTVDIATKGGQYDVLTIGTYEVPIWAKKNWLVPLDNLGADYDVDDLLPAIRAGLSVDGKLYAAPFYGESSMIMYRKDLFEKAGLTMPEKPTWDFIVDAAKKLTDKAAGIYGICLRGKAGWGENMAFLTAMSNSFGARWFDEKWNPQFDSPEWKETLDHLSQGHEGSRPARRLVERLQRESRPVQLRQMRHVDRCHGGCRLRDRPQGIQGRRQGRASRSRPTRALARTPTGCGPGRSRFRPARKKVDAAEKFICWATSKQYAELVASKEGWAHVPPGTRKSLYDNPKYQKAAPFAKLTLEFDQHGRSRRKPTVKPVPYVGVQFVAIPEFQGLGTKVGQFFSAALAGSTTGDEALASAQKRGRRAT